MLYPKEPSLSAELFRHPTAAYPSRALLGMEL